jgi:hypothetical protein
MVNWHVSEEVGGKWRPARCCGFGNLFTHIGMRLRITWRVFTGRLDAVNWESGSGERPATEQRYADFKTPGWKNATRVEVV